jgi:glyoxylase I family protein
VTGVLVAGIHHVTINVSDTARALEFYCGVLGMQPLPRPQLRFGGAWLDAGAGRQVHLAEEPVPPDLGQHVAFQVADVDAVIDALRARGIDVPPAKRVGDTNVRQTFTYDPDGNKLEFTEVGA